MPVSSRESGRSTGARLVPTPVQRPPTHILGLGAHREGHEVDITPQLREAGHKHIQDSFIAGFENVAEDPLAGVGWERGRGF